jgi:hypothetical protein
VGLVAERAVSEALAEGQRHGIHVSLNNDDDNNNKITGGGVGWVEASTSNDEMRI